MEDLTRLNQFVLNSLLKRGMWFQSLPHKLTCPLENWRTTFLFKSFRVHVSFRGCISTTPNVDFGFEANRLAELLTARWNLDQGCLQSGSSMIEFAGGKVVVIQFSNMCWSKRLAKSRQIAPCFCVGILHKPNRLHSASLRSHQLVLYPRNTLQFVTVLNLKTLSQSPAANCTDFLLHFSYEGTWRIHNWSSKGGWIQPQSWRWRHLSQTQPEIQQFFVENEKKSILGYPPVEQTYLAGNPLCSKGHTSRMEDFPLSR